MIAAGDPKDQARVNAVATYQKIHKFRCEVVQASPKKSCAT